jgi:hypothetical protein
MSRNETLRNLHAGYVCVHMYMCVYIISVAFRMVK